MWTHDPHKCGRFGALIASVGFNTTAITRIGRVVIVILVAVVAFGPAHPDSLTKIGKNHSREKLPYVSQDVSCEVASCLHVVSRISVASQTRRVSAFRFVVIKF